MVVCSTLLARATVTYTYSVPASTSGVAYQVNRGALPRRGFVLTHVVRVNQTHVHVIVRLVGVSQIDIATVAIEYYH